MDFKKSKEYISSHNNETIEYLCKFLPTDTLLFWSDKDDLFAFQKQRWQPLLDVLNTVFKLNLRPSIGLESTVNNSTINTFAILLRNLSLSELTGCFLISSELKSVLLGLLLTKQKITVAQAIDAAFLEEIYQNRFWGEDVAAMHARQKSRQNLESVTEQLKNV